MRDQIKSIRKEKADRFSTFKNPKTFNGRCSYENWREDRFEDMLVLRDVHSTGVEKLAPLDFLPTCIGCSKRWACTASRQTAVEQSIDRMREG